MAPKLHGLTSRNTDTNSNSTTENQNVFEGTGTCIEGLSSVVTNYIPRKGGALDVYTIIHPWPKWKQTSQFQAQVAAIFDLLFQAEVVKRIAIPYLPQVAAFFALRFPALVEANFVRQFSGPSNFKIRSATSESVFFTTSNWTAIFALLIQAPAAQQHNPQQTTR